MTKIYDATNVVWILEIKGFCESIYHRAPETKMSTRLDKVCEAARKYLGGDCSIQARNILDGRTVDIRSLLQ
jgi:hypothetical protein